MMLVEKKEMKGFHEHNLFAMHIAHLVNGGHVMTFVFRIGTLVVRGSHVPTDRVLVEVGRSPTSINTTWKGNSKASFCDRAVVHLQFLWLVYSKGDIDRKFLNSRLFDFFPVSVKRH